MSGFSVFLTKDGLRREGDGETFVPGDVFELLGAWHGTLEEIDPDYTLGDLCSLLRGAEGIAGLSPMFACDVRAFLAEAQAAPAEEDVGGLCYLEVYNTVDLTGYVPDSDHPDEPMRWVDDDEAEVLDAVADALHDLIGTEAPRRIVDASADDPITGKPLCRRVLPGTQNGTWTGPYRVDREFRGWGRWDEPPPGFLAAHPEVDPPAHEGAIAVDFLPLNALAHLPLRYNAAVAFRDGGPRGGHALLEDRITITFGELVHAVFSELGCMGSPRLRDENRALLRKRLIELGKALGGEDGDPEPWR